MRNYAQAHVTGSEKAQYGVKMHIAMVHWHF